MKTRQFQTWTFLLGCQIVLDKMATIFPDLKWSGFRTSDPIQNLVYHLQTGPLFDQIKSVKSGFQIPTVFVQCYVKVICLISKLHLRNFRFAYVTTIGTTTPTQRSPSSASRAHPARTTTSFKLPSWASLAPILPPILALQLRTTFCSPFSPRATAQRATSQASQANTAPFVFTLSNLSGENDCKHIAEE